MKKLVDSLNKQIKTLENDKLNITLNNRHKEERLLKAEARIKQF
jgi:hypothetical protein